MGLTLSLEQLLGEPEKYIGQDVVVEGIIASLGEINGKTSPMSWPFELGEGNSRLKCIAELPFGYTWYVPILKYLLKEAAEDDPKKGKHRHVIHVEGELLKDTGSGGDSYYLRIPNLMPRKVMEQLYDDAYAGGIFINLKPGK